jgi:hypothetical protein
MLLMRAHLDVHGDTFSPRKAGELITEPWRNWLSNEPGDAIEWKGRTKGTYDSGNLSIEHPTDLGTPYQLDDYLEWYIGFIERNHSALRSVGAESFHLFLDVFYSHQCNMELFNPRQFAVLATYVDSLPISVYKLTKDQLIGLLSEYPNGAAAMEDLLAEEP